MKYDITRTCGHADRVKVYEIAGPSNVKHLKLVLKRESFKLCRECSLAKIKERINEGLESKS